MSTPFEILGFDGNHGVHITSYDQLKIVVQFAEEHGFPDHCVDDEEDWFDYPYLRLTGDESEMNANSDDQWLASYVEFDDWYEERFGTRNPNLNSDLKLDLSLIDSLL